MGPAVAHRSDATSAGAGTTIPGEPRSGISPGTGRAPTAAATTAGAPAPPACELGDSTAPEGTDRDPPGEPRSGAAADVSALLVPHRDEEPRSGVLLGWLGEPDAGHAPAREDNLLHVTEPTSGRDRRLTPDPGPDPFVDDLLGPACPAGTLPSHPTCNLFTCTLAPSITPADDAYLPPACVMCVMLEAGFRVISIGPLPPRQARQAPEYAVADRRRAQY